jgi:hypothetical protein
MAPKNGRGGSVMGWGAVWQLGLKQFAAETVEVQLVLGLALAFSVLMILVGLRHAFRPAGPHRESAASEPFRHRVPAPVAAMAAPAQPFQARKLARRLFHKPVKPSVSALCSPRPLIRRAGAPTSPLMPRR